MFHRDQNVCRLYGLCPPKIYNLIKVECGHNLGDVKWKDMKQWEVRFGWKYDHSFYMTMSPYQKCIEVSRILSNSRTSFEFLQQSIKIIATDSVTGRQNHHRLPEKSCGIHHFSTILLDKGLKCGNLN